MKSIAILLVLLLSPIQAMAQELFSWSPEQGLFIPPVTVTAQVQESTSGRISMFELSSIAAMAAHGSDLATTEYCLGAGKCTELNPALRLFTRQPAVFGAVKMGIAGLQLWGISKLHVNHPKTATAFNYISTAVFAGIAYHNSRVGAK